MKLSNKRESALYSAVYEEIMRSRIKIAKLLSDVPLLGKEVDNILSDLIKDAPQAAINVFEKK